MQRCCTSNTRTLLLKTEPIAFDIQFRNLSAHRCAAVFISLPHRYCISYWFVSSFRLMMMVTKVITARCWCHCHRKHCTFELLTTKKWRISALYMHTQQPLLLNVVNKNLAIANRSRVSCAHNTLRAFIG